MALDIAANRSVDVDGVETHYLEAGAGEPLVLLHGGGPANCGDLTWRGNLAALSARFRVLVPDLAGFGRSGHPKGDLTIRGRLPHAAGFLRALGLERVHLVGHSQGGFVATRIAIEAPELVGRLAIVSSGTTAPNGNLGDDGLYLPAVQRVIDFGREPTYERFGAIIRSWTYFPERIDDAWLRSLYELMLERDNLSVYQRGTVQNLAGRPDAYAALHRELIAPYVGELRVPTLVAWGRDDDFASPSRGLELLALLPRAELHLFPEAKHLVMWDQPRAFERVLTAFCA